MADVPINVPQLDLETMLGFNGKVGLGLNVHPGRSHLIYPVGCTVVIEDIGTNKQEFLSGHSHNVSCICISKDGRYIASGQSTYMGFKADVIIWDFASRKMLAKLTPLHKVKVERMAFSPSSKYLVSLGGGDDGSIVVWDVATAKPLRGQQAQVKSAGITYSLVYSNNDDNLFVTGGDGSLRVWRLDMENKQINPVEVVMGQFKRVIKSIAIVEDDSSFYCGTTTGDILQVNMKACNFQAHGPTKDRFSRGVTAISILKTGQLVVGAGDGTVCVVEGPEQKFKRTKKMQKVSGTVNSIALRGLGHQFYIGTDECNIYRFNLAEFSHQLMMTCHDSPINDVAFPQGCDDILATCSYQNIRIWHVPNCKELLRITVRNMTCNTIAITNDGSTIISGWDDGFIRAFSPETGTPLYTVQDAHSSHAVTAIAACTCSPQFVSGSRNGQVRIWKPSLDRRATPVIVLSFKEHTASVTCIKLRRSDKECVTSSDDGSCILWNLEKGVRLQMVHANTLFQYACYDFYESQFISAGTDRKIAYWECYDGSLIRELEGSHSGSINGLDISADGVYFVSGGDDKLVKVWNYDDGEVTHVGIGHSASIKRVCISPNERFVISVSSDGAILRWTFPFARKQNNENLE